MTIAIKDHEYRAHRAILCARSSFFMGAFYFPIVKQGEGEKGETDEQAEEEEEEEEEEDEQ